MVVTGMRKGKRAALGTILLMFASIAVCEGQQALSACESTTVDDNHDRVYSVKAKHFLSVLQHVVQVGDKRQFASLVRYPLRVNGQRTERVSTAGELINKYSQIVTPDMKRAILAQSADCLFANGQGVMIGQGQVWFDENSSGEMKIVSVNP